MRTLPLHDRIFLTGLLVLVAGFIGAALIYILSPDDAPATEVEFINPRAYEFQIERIGGKAAVYAVRFNEWFVSLWTGRQLASTVGVLSIVAALLCFWLARRISATAHQNEGDSK